MSQKPRTGAPAGAAPAPKALAKAAPINARPVGKHDPVAKVETIAKPAKTGVKSEPVVKPSPPSWSLLSWSKRNRW